MPKHGKNFRKALEGVNLQERLSVEDAVSKSLGASFAKFDETVDVAIRLGSFLPVFWLYIKKGRTSAGD